MSRPSHTSAATVLGLALAAAGIGFGIFVYAVPYRRVATTLKRRSGELRAAQTQASARAQEIERMRQDLVDVRGDSGGAVRRRTDVRVLQSELEQGLAASGAQVAVDRGRVRVRLAEEAVFEARGADLSRTGQQAMQLLAQVLSDRAARVLIAAPMGSHLPPRWLRAQYPTPVDLSAARSGSALRALVKGGARAPAMMAVIGMLEPTEETAPPTLDVEIEPHR